MIAKSIVIKGCGCRSGGCAEKVVEITQGGLQGVFNKTEVAVRQLEPNAEVSRGHSSFFVSEQAPKQVCSGDKEMKARTVPARATRKGK
jgi:hypothetical protein